MLNLFVYADSNLVCKCDKNNRNALHDAINLNFVHYWNLILICFKKNQAIIDLLLLLFLKRFEYFCSTTYLRNFRYSIEMAFILIQIYLLLLFFIARVSARIVVTKRAMYGRKNILYILYIFFYIFLAENLLLIFFF